MSIDVLVERVIPVPPDVVADYAMDWRNDPEWTQGIRKAELSAEADGGGFGAGAEVTRSTYFLGLRIDYVLVVIAHDPPKLLDLRSVAGAFPMRITYRFEEHAAGTVASMRVRGEPTGIYRAAALLVRLVIWSHLRRDLRDLSQNLTQRSM